MILDVLLPLIEEGSIKTAKAKQSLADLQALQKEIDNVKAAKRGEMEQSAVMLLKKIEKTDKAMLGRIIKKF
jgi:hypothetical protein